MSRSKEIGRLFFGQLERIAVLEEEISYADKSFAQYQLLQQIFVAYTESERLHFTTLFARMAYALQKSQAPAKLIIHIHSLRKILRQIIDRRLNPDDQQSFELEQGIQVLALTIAHLFDSTIPGRLEPYFAIEVDLHSKDHTKRKFQGNLRMVILGIDRQAEHLIGQISAKPEKNWKIHYNIADRNENFNPTIQVLGSVMPFPVTVQLLETEMTEPDHLYPRGIILEPDYLMDVSAIAECFKPTGPMPFGFLLKKFLPFQSSIPLVLGNIANFFLDELLSDPSKTFKALFPKVFQLNPLAFTLLSNQEIRDLMGRSQLHFVNLKRVILQDFEKLELKRDESLVEPTFYSEKHGLQGRLDVLFKGSNKTGIIELKSGKNYRPNIYGLNNNHFIQTLLYDVLVRAVFGEEADPINYILYSGAQERQLRFAPRIKAQQLEALQVRNQLVALEFQLANTLANNPDLPLLHSPAAFLFRRLNPSQFQQVSGYEKRDLENFQKTYHDLSELEQKYFLAFSGFIAREHLYAKTGLQGNDHSGGQSSLWLNSHAEKEDNFQILTRLKLYELNISGQEQFLVFNRQENHTNPLANFRKGDISILYPFIPGDTTPLNNQLLKCTITAIDSKSVVVRLRNPQTNPDLFNIFEEWNLEPDHLDSSFTGMYRSLFAFAQAPAFRRQLLLAKVPPRQTNTPTPDLPYSRLTAQQAQVLQQMIAAKDYFLLWGPPGTGKTSVMLKSFIQYILEQTDEDLLLLAYTNRAVDEICEAIHSIGEKAISTYLRVGSTFSTQAKFLPHFLNKKIEKAPNRAAILEILNAHRIYVGTVASFTNKQELIRLKKFKRVVIDEASQILEPNLVGLLPLFEQFILIGDHKQLPAVVVQTPTASAVVDTELKELGLVNLRNSLFERLYKQCLTNHWDWAFARLSYQGRMHRAIMAFPNVHFYEKILNILPDSIPASQRQAKPIPWQAPENCNYLEECLSKRRFLFLPTPTDQSSSNYKTNQYEAKAIVRLIKAFQKISTLNGQTVQTKEIGIITPYRAQIAQIRQALEENKLDWSQLTIDTVERYQGGAREIIIISLCTNNSYQLASLISASDEGIDRKLNVALTRARQHLVVLGNREILEQNDTYKSLMEYGGVYASANLDAIWDEPDNS